MARTLLAMVLVVAACSGTSAPTTSEAVTTTSSGTQTLIPGALIPADPATLVPFEDAEPVALGSDHHGVVSPNRRWAAVASGQPGGESQVNVIDLESLETVARESGSGAGLAVDDTGTAAWFDDGQLRLLPSETEESLVDLPAAPPYFSDTLSLFPDGRIGYLHGPEEERGVVSIVVMDGEDLTVHEVGQITAGEVDSDDSAAPSRDYQVPAVAWDVDNDRAIVILPDEDGLVVVDLADGSTEEHEFATAGSPGELITTRDAHLTGDGTLFIATGLLELGADAEDRESSESAQQLVAVDTGDWSSRLIPVNGWSLFPSPDGSVMATAGATINTDSEGGTEQAQEPVYLIDASTGEPLVGFEGRSGTISDIQYSSDSSELYVISEGSEGTNIDIVDVALEGLAGSLGFERISLVGEAGLIAFHTAG